MNKRQKIKTLRLCFSFVLFIAGLFTESYISVLLHVMAYLVSGTDIIIKAGKNILNRQFLDENFLMIIATFGAFAIKNFPEAAAVMLFFQTGEFFQDYAVGKSRKAISSLMDICPDTATVENNDGTTTECDAEDVSVGDIIIVKPGQRVPLDGIVVSGVSSLDMSSLTGESVPCDISDGCEVLSGSINLGGVIKIEVTKEFENSTASKILELVENASEKKARAENFITKFARVYTPAVVACAMLIWLVIPFVSDVTFVDSLSRALIFLVASCPCALVISIPLSFFAGIGMASKNGILIKGGNYLEALSKAQTVVFDKTGTVTCGRFSVDKIHPENMSENEFIQYAAIAESFSTHPVAVSIASILEDKSVLAEITDAKEFAGKGVSVVWRNKLIEVGNEKLIENASVNTDGKTAVYVRVNGKYAGYITVADKIKPGSKNAVAMLKKQGIKNTVMLTGDKAGPAEKIAKEAGIDEIKSQLLPADKIDIVEKIKAEKSGIVVFVGDGINDAPAITAADVGIAMGGVGSDAAIEAADVVIMNDDLQKIPQAIKIAKKTHAIVMQNIVFALGIKFAVLLLGALGFAGMWAAVFADVGVSVIAILNAMRMFKKTK